MTAESTRVFFFFGFCRSSVITARPNKHHTPDWRPERQSRTQTWEAHLVKKKPSSHLKRDVRKEKTSSLCFLLCILLLFCSLEYKTPSRTCDLLLNLRDNRHSVGHTGAFNLTEGSDFEGVFRLSFQQTRSSHNLLSAGTICAQLQNVQFTR